MDSFVCSYAHSDESVIFPQIRKSCEGFPFFADHDNAQYCVLHYPQENKKEEFLRALESKLNNKDFNFRGVWFPDVTSFRGFIFDAEVDFSNAHFDKAAFFNATVFQQNAFFNFATFKDNSSFSKAIFKSRTFFLSAVFCGNIDFSESNFESESIFINSSFKENALFSRTQFGEEINFTHTRFEKLASFTSVNFNKSVSFFGSYFIEEADFRGSQFGSQTSFREAIFNSKALFHYVDINGFFDLDYSTFKDTIEFIGVEQLGARIHGFFEKGSLSLESIKLEKPERVSFHSINLCPSWFVNIDPRKFVFTNIAWEKTDGKQKSIDSEVRSLKDRHIYNARRLLTIAYRQLASNAEENSHYEDASNFRRMAFETEWLEKKERLRFWIDGIPFESEKLKRRFGGSSSAIDLPTEPTTSFGIIKRFDLLLPLYKLTSRYGESWRWAFFVLTMILSMSAFLYTQFDFYVCPQYASLNKQTETCQVRKLGYMEGIKQSLSVATLQRVEHRKPMDERVDWVIGFETVLAPLQAALLALAIRRRFMR